MTTPNEFWLALHELVQAVEAEGRTRPERINNTVETFRKMAKPAQRQILNEMVEAVTFLQELYPRALVSVGESEQRRQSG
jgi:hypothetical protein